MRKNRVVKSLKSFLTKMSNLLNASSSRKGSPAIKDINKFKYVRNGIDSTQLIGDAVLSYPFCHGNLVCFIE